MRSPWDTKQDKSARQHGNGPKTRLGLHPGFIPDKRDEKSSHGGHLDIQLWAQITGEASEPVLSLAHTRARYGIGVRAHHRVTNLTEDIWRTPL
jgi:hypothetical protein